MQKEFLFAGFGGQGVMFAGQLLAYAAMDSGLEVTWIPSYGPEMRGGTAHCYVVISDRPIGSPVVRHPTVVVAFNNPSFERYQPVAAPDGLLVWNETLVEHQASRSDITLLPVPASAIADELDEMRLLNMVLLGATIMAEPVLPLCALKRALEAHMPAHRRNLMTLNMQALDRGAEIVTSETLSL